MKSWIIFGMGMYYAAVLGVAIMCFHRGEIFAGLWALTATTALYAVIFERFK